MKKFMRGVAAVETAAASLLAVFFLVGSLFLGRLALADRRAHAMARHAAALSAAGLADEDVRTEIQSYARALGETDPLVTLGRFDGSASAHFYQLREARVRSIAPVPLLFGGGHREIIESAVVEEDRP